MCSHHDNSKINELGIKENVNSTYSCKVCRREVTSLTAEKEEWYYTVKNAENCTMEKDEMKYYNDDNVEYVCHEHFQTLSPEEAGSYVEFGYPYLDSLSMQGNKITNY